jgi:hypothetical protein
MPETLHMPGSQMSTGRKVTWVAGGLGLFIVGLYIYKKRKAAQQDQSGATTTDQSGIDPSTGLPYSQESGGQIDPTTGVPYSQEYGYGGGYGLGYGGGGFGGGFPWWQQPPPSSTMQTVTTNAQWAQASEAYLQSLGYNPEKVALALGRYLSGQGLTNDEFNIVEAAIGFEGQPPQGAPPPHHIKPVGGQDSHRKRRHKRPAKMTDHRRTTSEPISRIDLTTGGFRE